MTSSSKSKQSSAESGYLGRTLDDRYRLDEVIGAGAIGKVYAGTQLAVDRKVAIKLLHPAIRDRELGKERFLREAKAVARLSHGSCLTLFDFGSDDDLGCFYMVTEFVEGTTLASEMQRGVLDVERCYHVLYQATTALQHAHDRGILHRDLKPENIMLVGESRGFSNIKVLDFGLARIREEAAQVHPEQAEEDASTPTGKDSQFNGSRLTNFGELNGTPAYMSPEQCRGELNLSPACDYYSLGVLAYELFEGRLPYESGAVHQLLEMHLNDPIPEMTSARAPQPVEEMIYRLLAKKPGHRLQSADEILEILHPYVSVDTSREFSRATLDRIRRETPDPGRTPPVAKSGAETLANFDDADAPGMLTVVAEDSLEADGLSRGSAFGTMVAPEDGDGGARQSQADEPEADSPKDESREGPTRSQGGVVQVIAALVLVLAAGGAWLFAESSGDESEAAVSDEPPAEAAAVEQSATASDDEPEEASDEHLQALTEDVGSADVGFEQSADAGGDAAGLEPDDEPSHQPAARADQAKERDPKPSPPKTNEDKDRQRPRKLELTY